MDASARDGAAYVACSCGCLRHRSAVERFSTSASLEVLVQAQQQHPTHESMLSMLSMPFGAT